MAQLDMAIDHGQTLESARENFEKAITAAHSQYGRFVERLEWEPDRSGVKVQGRGFDVRISYDHQKVYARGTIPMAAKMLEGPIRSFITRALK